MEKAIHITDANDLRHFNKKFTRIYFGNEFCERLIPVIPEVKKIIDFCVENKLNFTFITPYVTNKGIGGLKKIFDFLLKQKMNEYFEIVFNDYGVFNILKDSGFKLVLGRLLTKQKRGPRIITLKNKIPEEAYKHFKDAPASSKSMQNFLLGNNIKRIELDNLVQGINLKLDKRLKASLYYPYIYTTTTRSCLIANINKREPNVYLCKKECGNLVFELSSRNMPRKILIKGNTQFIFNDRIPEGLENMGVNRLVYQPKIPL